MGLSLCGMKASKAQAVESIIAQQGTEDLLLFCRGLPDDVVLDILARLPWAAKARFRRVCRTWNRVLLQTRRPFPFMGSGTELLDPLSLTRKALPAMIHGKFPLPMAACATPAYVVWIFRPRHDQTHERYSLALLNLQTMQWRHELPRLDCEEGLQVDGSIRAAIAGGYLYIVRGGRQRTSLYQVHRLKLQGDMAATMWERIPDMHEKRFNPAVLVLEGCVWVLGGATHDGQMLCVHSGEVWDSSLETWTLIPELWPSHLFGLGREAVVAAQGKIYAVSNRTEAVVYYEHAIRAWRNLCPLAPLLPRSLEVLGIWYLFAVGNELWLAYGDDSGDYIVTTMLTRTATASHIPSSWTTFRVPPLSPDVGGYF